MNQHGTTQMKIYDFIVSYINTYNYPPSIREICQGVGLKSPSTVHLHLNNLQEKGLIKKDDFAKRTISIVKENLNPFKNVPVVGVVTAGIPILAEVNIIDNISMPENLLGNGETFILKVKGDSMINAGIHNGDHIVVATNENVNNGDIVVAMIENEATVKRYYRTKNGIELRPENEQYQVIYGKNIDIIGKVISLFRRF
ncbi:MAG: transcriptional repressor LexA [Eubacteriales bacterium]|nr:transcriptional repressor LexA [Eubacteriales bacterium]